MFFVESIFTRVAKSNGYLLLSGNKVDGIDIIYLILTKYLYLSCLIKADAEHALYTRTP